MLNPITIIIDRRLYAENFPQVQTLVGVVPADFLKSHVGIFYPAWLFLFF